MNLLSAVPTANMCCPARSKLYVYCAEALGFNFGRASQWTEKEAHVLQDNYDIVDIPSTAGAVAFEDNFPMMDGTPVRSAFCISKIEMHVQCAILRKLLAFCGV